jgi:hypothetical protein
MEQVPDTLYLGQGRVAAIAEAGGMPHPELRHAVEDEEWLEQHFAEQAVFGPMPQ